MNSALMTLSSVIHISSSITINLIPFMQHEYEDQIFHYFNVKFKYNYPYNRSFLSVLTIGSVG
jgi:hypothetical protein